MPKKYTSKKKAKKRKTKKEIEEEEKKETKKLDKEIEEVNLEIKKIALKNKKIIIEDWEREPEGLTSHAQELEIEDSSPSLEMINAPLGRLVPLERVLQTAPTPNLLNGNGNDKNEFNPFKYTTGSSDSGQDGPKYTSYESWAGVERVDINQLSKSPEKMREVGFNPMHPTEKKSIETYVPVKGEDIAKLGKEKDFKKIVKYTPGGA